MTNKTSNEDIVELLDEVVGTLANYKLLQRRNKDRIGYVLTDKLIEEVKSQIETLGYNPKTLHKLAD